MSIERLNKAASAAGFAMATPDDDAAVENKQTREAAALPARAVVVSEQSSRLISSEAVNSITNWLKGHLPGVGGRQPA